MLTKRRFALFLLVLAVMLLVRYAAGAEPPQKAQPMEFRGPSGADSEAIEHAVYILMGGGIVFGMVAGGGRAIANNRRMKKDGYFTGDLTMMSLRDEDDTSHSR